MNLTNEEIKIKVAESLGWTHVQPIRYHGIKIVGVPPDAREPDLNFPTSDPDIWCALVPNYPESLDACAEFEARMVTGDRATYRECLAQICDSDFHAGTHWSSCSVHANSCQRCLAYLKTKGIIQ